MLSPADLRTWFEYDDGRLYWRMKPNSRIRVGSEAGTRRRDSIHVVTLGGEKIDRARIVWALHYGEWPAEGLRHRDGDSSNDRVCNLDLQSAHYRSDPTRSNLPQLRALGHGAGQKCSTKIFICQARPES